MVHSDWDAAMDRDFHASLDVGHRYERINREARHAMWRQRAERERRVRELMAKVDRDLGRVGKPKTHRGSRRPVVCVTAIDPLNGQHPWFRSVTDACYWLRQMTGNRRAPDNLCQAIARNGTCAGHRFAYADAAPPPPQRVYANGEQMLLWPWLDLSPLPKPPFMRLHRHREPRPDRQLYLFDMAPAGIPMRRAA